MKTKQLLFLCMALGGFLFAQAQTPKSVCEITSNWINGDHVATFGNVSSVSGGDFWITDAGCTVKCDLQDGVPAPSRGMTVVVIGYVEVDDKTRDENEIDVYTWAKEGTQPPDPPTATVFTVSEALSAEEGTVAFLEGSVTAWTDESDGEGTFTDNTGSMAIDFPDGWKPNLNQSIQVLGTVDDEDNGKEIDVIQWNEEGGTPPPTPTIAYSASEAASSPDGTLALCMGEITAWTNQPDGEGMFEDTSGEIQVDFEDGLTLPDLDLPITIFGVVDTENKAKEIETHFWTADYVGVEEMKSLGISMYPNPATNLLKIESKLDLSYITIVDLAGRKILEHEVSTFSNIDVSQITKGIYLVNLYNTNGLLLTEKLVIR